MYPGRFVNVVGFIIAFGGFYDQVAQVDDMAPRHIGVTRLELARDRVRGLANDLE